MVRVSVSQRICTFRRPLKSPPCVTFLGEVGLSVSLMTPHWVRGWRAVCSLDLTLSRREHLDGKMEGIMRKNSDLGASQSSVPTYSSLCRESTIEGMANRGVCAGLPERELVAVRLVQ